MVIEILGEAGRKVKFCKAGTCLGYEQTMLAIFKGDEMLASVILPISEMIEGFQKIQFNENPEHEKT
ncbi:MAG: hypothetical protein ABSG90_11830 [Dehalococcoidia bacterium]|jgi:hypothetical protein